MKQTQQYGFTMLELLIVVAIVAIVSSSAIYYYGKNVVSANRTDGRSGLQITATKLEKCKTLYGSFNSPNCSISNGDTVQSPETLYDITVTSAASTFTLKAVQSATPQPEDTECDSMSINNLGKKTGTGSDSTKCW